MTQNTPSKSRPLLKCCLRCGLFALLAFLVFACWSVCRFFIREGKMQDFCGQIVVGMPRDAVITLAEKHEYDVYPHPDNEDPVIVVDGKTMGRFICEVRIQQGCVIAAEYVLND
uniref:hypothetical protein n=1 Tax=Candidatus Electronema sp. TaxID=2698783 RepID=UPI0040564D80